MTEIEKLAEVIKKVNCDNNCDHDKNEETNGCCDLFDCCIQNIATALYKQGYRKQEDTVKEFAEKLKDTITEEIALCEQKRSELLYGGQWIVLTEKKIVLMVQIKMLNELAEQYGKEEK